LFENVEKIAVYVLFLLSLTLVADVAKKIAKIKKVFAHTCRAGCSCATMECENRVGEYFCI